MPDSLPPLRALRYFQRAARHQSVSLAARSLNVTHSAVSHQIRLLEEWLAAPLFVRASGRIHLTADGEQLSRVCSRAFADIAESCERIRGQARHGLTISCAPSFLAQWLIPRIGRFNQQHPDVPLSFDTLTDPQKLHDDRTDVLILSHDHLVPEGVATTLIAVDYIGPVCSPLFRGRMSYAADFSALPLLHADTRAHAWEEWAQKTGARGDFWAGKHFDNLTLAIQAARNGLGIIMTPQILVKKELREGTLCAPLGFAAMDRATWMMVRQARQHEPAIDLFRRWLLEEAAED